MGDVDYLQISEAIRDAIAESPKKSKRVLLKTLLKMFGHKTRQKHWVEAIQSSFSDVGILMSPLLVDLERDDWVVLSVTDPNLPVKDFTASQIDEESISNKALMNSWASSIGNKIFHSEKEVEIRFVIPLLEHLGYSEDDRADGYPVEQVVGVRKTKTEADFVLFDGANRCKDSALLVVEAKNVGKKIADHVSQARSYAMFLGTPYYLVTNGDDIRVFLYRSPIESDVEVFNSTRVELPASLNSLYNLISKQAIIAYRKKKMNL